MGLGQRVRLPGRSSATSLPDRGRRSEHPSITSPGSIGSAICEEHARNPRGSARQAPRQAVADGRRVRVRSRHRPGVPQDRQRDPPARLPRRQGAAQGARGPHRPRPGPRAGAARRHSRTTSPPPCASTTSTSSPPRRSSITQRRGDGPGGRSTPRARCAPRSRCPGTAGCASSCPSPRRHRRRDRRGGRRPSCAATARSSTSTGRCSRATRSRSTLAGVPRRRAGAGAQHRGLAVRGRQAAGSHPASTPNCSAPSTGDELTFTATPNGTEEPADFEVTIDKVQEMVLPELTDEWVDENIGEFDTVDAFRAVARPSASAPASSTRPATSSSTGPPPRSPSWSTSSRRSRWCSGDLQAARAEHGAAVPGAGHLDRPVAAGHRPGSRGVHRRR